MVPRLRSARASCALRKAFPCCGSPPLFSVRVVLPPASHGRACRSTRHEARRFFPACSFFPAVADPGPAAFPGRRRRQPNPRGGSLAAAHLRGGPAHALPAPRQRRAQRLGGGDGRRRPLRARPPGAAGESVRLRFWVRVWVSIAVAVLRSRCWVYSHGDARAARARTCRSRRTARRAARRSSTPPCGCVAAAAIGRNASAAAAAN